MNLTIEASKDGYLAFGEGVAFFAPTRTEAAAGAIKEMESRPQEPEKEYAEVTDIIHEMHGVFDYPDLGVHVSIGINLQPKNVTTEIGAQVVAAELKKGLDKASLGLSAVSAMLADVLLGKKRIIILEKI